MGMIKKSETKESGVDAAIDRLRQVTPAVITASSGDAYPSQKTYKPRDFDKEARGKTRCVMYAAALGSMALAGAKWKTTDDLKKLIREMADDGVTYSFQD